MRKTSVLCAAALATALLLSGCAKSPQASSGAKDSPRTTAATLRALTGRIGVNEVEHGSIEQQAAAASVVVVGPVLDITDLGPADPAGSVTHVFRLTVKVNESIKGAASGTVDVTVFGAGNAGEMRRGLTSDAGLWMLVPGRTNEFVPVETAAVLFEQDAVVVAPLAEVRVKPDADSLGHAIAKSRQGAKQR